METVLRNTLCQKICKYDPQNPVNLTKNGGKVRGIYKQLSHFQEKNKATQVKNIIIHAFTKHLPRDNPEDTAKKLCQLVVRIQYQFPDPTQLFCIPEYSQNLKKMSLGDIN